MDLALEGLTLRRGGGAAPAALLQVDFAVRSGEAVAVVGPSGAGKSTLLEVAAAALRPTEGRVLLDGTDPWTQDASGLRALRRRLFLAPQVPPLPPRQRVVTAVLAGRLPQWSLWRSLRSLVYPVDLADAQAALLPFGLAERLFDRVDRLSGGERQRVSLARGFLSDARLWLLDEPLSALDPARADAVIGAVRAEAARRGATLVASLHQVELARAHFPRLVGLRAGRLVFDAPAAALDHAQLASLFEGAAAEQEAEGDTPAAAAPPVRMHCR